MKKIEILGKIMNESNKIKFPCPCCRFLTVSEQPPGSYEICPICGWEDDSVQFHNPKVSGGANDMSLSKARENFKMFGAISKDFLKYVRAPNKNEIPS